ncbi:hypothetical protein SRABI98_03556 [Microbacterium sp. Bi98]|uniref:hypothetical protein n=1 Tax=Microbacterium sp. Bi98 TaxID=2821116 RepID=UPI001DABE340|nr:hypothetical protein [Microbacterium sp. Bi98]CAH0262988.1 hypothetical protein SRABI98_03556 [Microbacterium sp. Bi98]
MNKQTTFIVIAVLAGLGLVGVIALQLVRPDASATFIDFVFQLLMLLGGFGGLAYMQGQQGKEIQTIKKNTNGTLSRKDDEIATYRAALAEHAPHVLRQVETDAVPIVTRAQLREEREGEDTL